MIKKLLFLMVLLSVIIIPASAFTFSETHTDLFSDNTYATAGSSGGVTANGLYFQDSASPDIYKGLYFVTYDVSTGVSIGSCAENTNYKIIGKSSAGNNIFIGTIAYDNDYDIWGTKTNGYFWIHVNSVFTNNITTTGSFYIYDSDNTLLSQTIAGAKSISLANSNSDVGYFCFYHTGGAGDLGDLSIYYNIDFETTVSGECDTPFSSIKIERNGFISNFTVKDSNDILIRNDYSATDTGDFEIFDSSFSYTLVNELGTIFENEYTLEEDLDLYLELSKTPIAIKEDVYCYLGGISSFTGLNRIIWNINTVDSTDSTIEGESYVYNLVRYNTTHWYYSDIHMSDSTTTLSSDYGYIAESSLTTQIQKSFNQTGYKRFTCNLFDNDMSLIGSPEITLEVGEGLGEYLQFFVRTIDTSDGSGLSGCELNIYYIDETGDHLDQTITMTGSQQEVILEIGKTYKIYASKSGYSTEIYQFTAITSQQITMYLTPGSTGYSSLTFIVFDSDYERLQYVKVDVDDEFIYTNIGGIASISDLAINTTINYTVSLSGYITETGSIYANDENEEIQIMLYTEVEVYPTEEETEGLTEDTYSEGSIIEQFIYIIMQLGISYDDAKFILGGCVILVFGFLGLSKGLLPGILTATIGLMITLGIGLMPMWIAYVLILVCAALIAYRIRM